MKKSNILLISILTGLTSRSHFNGDEAKKGVYRIRWIILHD